MSKLSMICLLAVALLGLPHIASAEETFPKPVEKWWEQLEKGNSATYDMAMSGQKMQMTMTVDKIEGSKVTVSIVTKINGQAMPAQSKTFDGAKDKLVGGDLPKDVKIEKVENKTYKVGDTSFDCTVYKASQGDNSTNCWYSRQLAPIFSGSNVLIETSANGQKMSIKLSAYDGPLLEE